MPCVPYGGQENQGFWCIPGLALASSGVQGSDLEFPIWVGAYGVNRAVVDPHPQRCGGKERRMSKHSRPGKYKPTKAHDQFEDADGHEMVILVEATHKHVVTLDKDGIQITDGVNGNKIIMGQDGIQLGSSGAHEHFVLGDQFMANVKEFVTKFNTHKHILTVSPPVLTGAPDPTSLLTPQDLQVPLSAKHKVE